MLENVIGRSPKAWGLGQNPKICFPPARGAYFSINRFQNPNLEVRWGGVNLPGGAGAGSRFLAFFAIFLNFKFISNFMGLRPHFGRFFASKPRFWLPKTRPKSIQNAFKIEVPKNMQFFNAFLFIFSLSFIFDFLKTCILPQGK